MPLAAEISRLYPGGYFTHPPAPCDPAPTSGGAGALRMRWVAEFRTGWRKGRAPRDPAGQSPVCEQLGEQLSGLRRLLPGPMNRASRRPEYWLPHPASSAKLLDVGCGAGEFVRTMRQVGWDAHGVEPDPAAVQAARTIHDVPVVEGTLEELGAESATFDAVTMLHVIEHLPDPQATLREAWRLLRPGGRLLVVTPNARSLGARVFGSAWVAWEPPRHLHVFTRAALRRLLVSAGFVLERSWCTGRNARWTWEASAEIRRTGRCESISRPQRTPAARWGGRLARLAENTLPDRTDLGEELVAVGFKPPAASAGVSEA